MLPALLLATDLHLIFMILGLEVSEMPKQLKVSSNKPEDSSSIPRRHTVEGDK